MKKNKLLLIGWDAADWKIIGPMLANGLMPALKKIIDNGVYGNMSTMNPPYSPMLWSSVATGKTPDKHGVLGFIEVVPNKKALRPVTVNSRKARAVWNILHNQGFNSNLVGWWPSFPAEPINGVVVTDKFQKVNADPSKPSPLAKGAIHPVSLVNELKDLRMFPHELTKEHILPFIPQAKKIDQNAKNNGLIPFSKILSQNVSIQNAATYLLRNTEWDFMAIYFDMIDHFCHAFMKYHPPKLDKIPKDQYEIYKDVIVGAYRFQDMMLGRVLDLIDEQTTVIVMSDHGFESGRRRMLKLPKVTAAPAMDHRQFGIFCAMGPNIKKNEKIFGLSLIDVAPTILHHFGLPVGRDMDGKVLLDIFKSAEKIEYIESWEDVKGDFAELENRQENDDLLSDEEAMEQLIELGYVERPNEKIDVAILKTRCELKHNLSRVHLGKKNYETAEEILSELITKEDPIDVGPYYMDLIHAYIGMRNFEKADETLQKFKTIETKVSYNTYFLESEILIGKGQIRKALKILIKAKGKRPSAELWFRIGKAHKMLDEFAEAKHALESAIELEQDKAKFHQLMGEVLYELGEYEESAEFAFTSIELVKYFGAAHYTLGKALEKLGDHENAKLAFKTAASLKPKSFHRAEKALENIEIKLKQKGEMADKSTSVYHQDQIVIVSGLPRSGTSLMMQMLDKGGIDVLTDENRKADISNPKGYYEYDPVMSIHKDNKWLEKAKNKSVKVVAPLLKFLDPEHRYKVVFMNRDLTEIVKSQQKMIGKSIDNLPVNLFEAYNKHLKQVENWKEREPGVELIYINYKDVLEDTESVTKKIEKFLCVELDTTAMASCVDKSLYRNKAQTKKELES